MSQASTIEWTDATWNPVRGCTKVSPGCKHCYAETFAERWRGVKGHPYEQGFDLRLVPEKLAEPLTWRKPRRVFVNSMSDLFHEDVPDSFIMRVWLTMARTPQHTYQVLTKRAERMSAWVKRWCDVAETDNEPKMARGPAAVRAAHKSGRARMFAEVLDAMGEPPPGCAFPTYDWMEGPRWLPGVLPNVWLGVSVEGSQYLTRLDDLAETPAAIRWVSLEPLLTGVNIRPWLGTECMHEDGYVEPETNAHICRRCDEQANLDWVVIGGESGPGARPFDLTWARRIVVDCKAAGVPVFVKQLGARPMQSQEAALVAAGLYPDDCGPSGRRPERMLLEDRKGGEPAEWPEDLRVREWPSP